MSDSKTAKIVTCLTEDDRAWLQRESNRLGLDASSYIRMTLRRERERESSGQQVAVA
jgi:hypothetical protein